MKYLHIKCIQKWVMSQVKTKNSNSMMLYYWKKLKCELCKQSYKSNLAIKF
jgi:CDP-diacylglycerol pyrophosphatase